MGQAFYSLSLGMGIMVAYGSYTGKEIKIGKSIAMISIFDTLVAILAGLAIFPAVGALAPELFAPENSGSLGGVGLVYSVLPMIFERMGDIGQFVSFFFFAMIVIAAVTSVISLVETGVQFVIQKFKAPRKIATLAVCGLCCLVSIPVAWSVGGAFDGSIILFGKYDMLTFMDDMTNVVLMPLGAFCSCFAIGWLMDEKVTANPFKTLDNLKKDGLELHPVFGNIFAVMVKYVTPVLILFIEIVGVLTRVVPALGGNVNFWFTIGFALLLAVISIVVYFIAFYKRDTGTNADELAIGVKTEEKVEANA
jgi:NSS family neurotransmitter:Na+ symporter